MFRWNDAVVKWGGTFEKELRLILDEVAGKYGFCDHTYSAARLHHRDVVTAVDFADFVLIAEGMDPERETEWRRTLALAFIDWFGRESLAASEYPPLPDKK